MIDPREYVDVADRAAMALARRYGGRPSEWVGFAYEIMAGAALRHDPARGVSFPQFATVTILRRGVDEAAARLGLKRVSSHNDGSRGRKWASRIERRLGDREDSPAKTAEPLDLESVLRLLPEPHAQVLRLRARGMRHRQIAEFLGVSESKAMRLFGDAVARARGLVSRGKVG